ncbi:hypothetical protein HYH03_008474 [Edaphochlamys debaryana]|uniref:DNA ligase n=1 Tax=Edaphochlamys debaryana TaxID=47281 RepID=A0A835Y6F9_9CHLO|nr:hypothetical protein HYH03_008474 [Edaphochlamys debaryana]|eukprot:KAG2493340.1 hypothetical protein HYH03_008474 [Edaphochlamys debaryana]
MKQKSIGAFFSGAKSAPKDSSNKPAAAQAPEKAKAEPVAEPKKADLDSDQENDANQLDAGAKPARKRLRRTVIEDDDDDSKPSSSGKDTAAAKEAALEDTPMAEAGGADAGAAAAPKASEGEAGTGEATAKPTEAPSSSAPAPAPASEAKKPTAPLASIFQKPAVRKAAAAAAAAAARGSSPAGKGNGAGKAAAKAPSTSTGAAAGSPAKSPGGKASGAAGADAKQPSSAATPAATATATEDGAGAGAGPSTSAPSGAAKKDPPLPKKQAAAAEQTAEKKAKRQRAAKAAAAEDDDEEEEDGEEGAEGEDDPISDSDDDAGGEVNDILTDGAAAALKKKAGKKKGATKAGKGVQMEGVGTGALEAAAKYGKDDFQKLITWKEGAPVPYALLADTFEAIAETTKRLEIVALLVSAFRAVLASHPASLLPTVYLCVNRVAPAHTGIELGIGEATLIKALCEATGKNEASIKKAYEGSGDLGVVAVGARSTQRTMFTPPPLTIASVLKSFRDIAQTAGSKSVDHKKGMIVKMLAAAKGNEAGYIVRSLQAKLRIGLAEQSVLVALAHAVQLHRHGADNDTGRLAERLEAAAQVVKQAYSECPSYDILIPALLEHGTADLPQHCHFTPGVPVKPMLAKICSAGEKTGVPVKPMLAKPTTGVGEVLEKFTDSEFTVEYKYDGERAQVHVLDGGKTVHIFSRNSENNTPKYPDIVARIRPLLKPHVRSIVFDSEAVAYDHDKKKILPFQVLSTRARKDVAVGDIKVQVVLFAFDCLFLNGESLLHKPLTERREALYSALETREGELQFASFKTSRDVEELESFLTESVEAGTEGLIVKTLKDTYEPSKRSSHWLKLKKDYMEGVGDTFDVVPLGAFYGKGKRTGVFGAYLLGIYDPDTETYQTISKLGTGFSEEQLGQLADAMRPHIIQQPRTFYRWSDALEPDVWFDPAAVWEVKAADLSISPVHKAAAGLVDPSKGISIRFPRLIRVREDKSPEDATSATQVAEMFSNQAVIRRQQADKAKADQEPEEED